MKEKDFADLFRELLSYGKETEWIEFKVNNYEPHNIGEYLSALSNSAYLNNQKYGYIIWGVQDETLSLVGTNFRPRDTKFKNQELENWLVTQLTPRVDVRILEGKVSGSHVVIFQIQAMHNVPVSFKGKKYVRVDTNKKLLCEHPEKERELWIKPTQVPFEEGISIKSASSEKVLELLDYPSFFDLFKLPLPSERSGIIDKLKSECLIIQKSYDRFDITNIGAILFAKSLKEFDTLERKAPRVILYKGENKLHAIRELNGNKGYAVGFEGLIEYFGTILPQNEHLESALRAEVSLYPIIAVRELIANALIHQDFHLQGTGPMI